MNSSPDFKALILTPRGARVAGPKGHGPDKEAVQAYRTRATEDTGEGTAGKPINFHSDRAAWPSPGLECIEWVNGGGILKPNTTNAEFVKA